MPFRTEIGARGLVGVGLDLTQICNRSCLTCFATAAPKQMQSSLFRRIIDQGAAAGFTELYILGGEPTLHPEIIDCLEYGRARYELVILVTNMDRLADRSFCQLVEATGVTIAGQRHTMVDTATARQTERLLTGGEHFDSSFQAWENVGRIFPPDRVCVQCCITKPVVDTGSIYDVFRWTRQMGYEPVIEFTKEGQHFKRGCAFDISSSGMMATFRELQRIDREEFGLPGASLLSPQAYGKTCHMQETSIHFLVNGEAVPCVGFPGLNYGNIKEQSLAEILNDPLRQLISRPKEWIFGYCHDECPHFAACTGGCRGSSFDMSGCYRASFYYCPHIPRDRLSLREMIPPTCSGCPLEGNPTCHPNR